MKEEVTEFAGSFSVKQFLRDRLAFIVLFAVIFYVLISLGSNLNIYYLVLISVLFLVFIIFAYYYTRKFSIEISRDIIAISGNLLGNRNFPMNSYFYIGARNSFTLAFNLAKNNIKKVELVDNLGILKGVHKKSKYFATNYKKTIVLHLKEPIRFITIDKQDISKYKNMANSGSYPELDTLYVSLKNPQKFIATIKT